MGSSKPLETALDAFIYVSFGVPESYSKKRKEACLNGSEKHIKKPDLDNVVKAVLDGCEKVIFLSDAQIVYTHSFFVTLELYSRNVRKTTIYTNN
jgi:Holliday junction resolvase RusA-like endonuclease